MLAALSAIEVTEVGEGHSAELVLGVGLATWIAHLFAELLAEHVRLGRAGQLAAGAARQPRRQPDPRWSTFAPGRCSSSWDGST